MTWHPEVLAARQQKVLARLGPVLTRRGFYLAGGTAVALHLGHRRSVDFDWFTAEGLDDPAALADELRGEDVPLITDQVAAGTLHGAVGGVRVSLLRYRYPLLGRLRNLRHTRVASKPDLAAMKLSALAQRGAKKDFVDVYALAKRCFSLTRMLDCYREKFSVTEIGHLLYSLVYFDDADRERMPRLLWDANWRDIKDSMRRWVLDVF